MKKVYLAKRIPKEPNSKFVLSISKDMSTEDIFKAYIEKIEVHKTYIYNGPWVLRPPLSEDVFSVNNMPKELTPLHVWKMVKEKIESSDVYLGIINSKSYGTIAETGYACKCKNVAVYILPEFGITADELQDLWFVFQIALINQHLWCDEDIIMLTEFSDFGIDSVDKYRSFISEIMPNFMKK